MRYNLIEYWPRQMKQFEQTHVVMDDDTVVDGVLTLGRILYTTTWREVISKVQAGQYALETVHVRWHPIIREVGNHAPKLDSEAKQWLLTALKRHVPESSWIDELVRMMSIA